MEFLTNLWLPILLSAVLVFIASSVMHMVLPIHRGDYRKLPGEENVLGEMRKQGVTPGAYWFPHAPMKEMNSPEMIKKFEQGPVGFVAVKPSGKPSMAKSLVQWFLYSVLLSVFVAYVAAHALGRGVEYLTVFRITGAVAVVGYAIPSISESIWKFQSWGATVKYIVDGVIYALVTAGTFAWLWPDRV